MNYIHKNAADGRWFQFSIFEQMANIGVDIGRTIHWRAKDKEISKKAFERALELLDLTIEDKKNKKHLTELCRLREVLADCFYFDNEYSSTDKNWDDYFYGFNYASAVAKGY